MTLPEHKGLWVALTIAAALMSGLTLACAQQEPQRGATSYMPVDIKEPFAATMARMRAAQPAIQKRQADLQAERYDLANSAAAGVTMSRGKPVQAGVRARLPAGTTWEQLATTAPNDIRERNLFPKAFPTIRKAAWCSPSSRSRSSRSRRRAISRASTSNSTCPTISCRSSRRRSI